MRGAIGRGVGGRSRNRRVLWRGDECRFLGEVRHGFVVRERGSTFGEGC